MSNIKRWLLAYDDEVGGDEPSLQQLMEWMDLNAELFEHLPIPNDDDTEVTNE